MSDPVPNQLSNTATPNVVSSEGGVVTPQPQPGPGGEPGPANGRGRGFLANPLVLRLGLIALIVVGGIVVRDFVGGDPDSLRPGDCIDAPGTEAEVEQVQHHPCGQAHSAEVFAVFNYPAARDAAYPDEATMDDVVMSRCYSEFGAYTGSSFDVRDELDMSYMYPTQDGWRDGDRKFICLLLRVDGAVMNASMRGTGG